MTPEGLEISRRNLEAGTFSEVKSDSLGLYFEPAPDLLLLILEKEREQTISILKAACAKIAILAKETALKASQEVIPPRHD